MRNFLAFAVALICFSTLTAQQRDIQLYTNYGSDNKELHDILRFQDIETINLKFTGEQLKGKNYTILVKEFTNGNLSKTDTIISSKAYSYVTAIDTTHFEFKYFVKTQIDHKIKMTFMFNRFSTTKLYDIKATEDNYALHDFLGGNASISVKTNTKTYVLGYFLPYLDIATGWKKYCEVSGSKHQPEQWGNVFDIPNYFLVEVLFE